MLAVFGSYAAVHYIHTAAFLSHGRDISVALPQVSPDLRSADPKTISRGITVLSNSQSYVKSFDGMAYELKGKLKKGTSTDDIQTVRGEGARENGVGEISGITCKQLLLLQVSVYEIRSV